MVVSESAAHFQQAAQEDPAHNWLPAIPVSADLSGPLGFMLKQSACVLPHFPSNLVCPFQILLRIHLCYVGSGVPESHLGRLDAVFSPNLGPSIMSQLVGVPVWDRETVFSGFPQPIVYRPTVRIGIVTLPFPLLGPAVPAGVLDLLSPAELRGIERRLPLSAVVRRPVFQPPLFRFTGRKQEGLGISVEKRCKDALGFGTQGYLFAVASPAIFMVEGLVNPDVAGLVNVCRTHENQLARPHAC